MEKKSIGMTGGRIILVHVLLAVILGGSAYAMYTNRETWPFSPYPMYSWLERDRSVVRLQLFGVTTDHPPVEIPIVALKHLQSFDDARLNLALKKITMRRHSNEALKEALGDLWVQYETMRKAGHHHGPPIQGMRLYQLEWRDINPRHFKGQTPDTRKLMGEFMYSASMEK